MNFQQWEKEGGGGDGERERERERERGFQLTPTKVPRTCRSLDFLKGL